MDVRQVAYSEGMLRENGQFQVAVINQAAPEYMWVNMEIQPAKTILDDHFPDTGGTEI